MGGGERDLAGVNFLPPVFVFSDDKRNFGVVPTVNALINRVSCLSHPLPRLCVSLLWSQVGVAEGEFKFRRIFINRLLTQVEIKLAPGEIAMF